MVAGGIFIAIQVSINHGMLSLMAKTSLISTFSKTKPPLPRTRTQVSSLSNAKNLPMIILSPSFNMKLLKYSQHKLFLHYILVFLTMLSINIVGSSNGLVCLHGNIYGIDVLWNPTTNETKVVPESCISYPESRPESLKKGSCFLLWLLGVGFRL